MEGAAAGAWCSMRDGLRRSHGGKYDRSWARGELVQSGKALESLKRGWKWEIVHACGCESVVVVGIGVGIGCVGGRADYGASGCATADAERYAESCPDFAKVHYEKHEYRVAMRDGVKLYTQVYTPIAGQFADKGPYPFLMTRTPYSCGSYDNGTVMPRGDEQSGCAGERIHPGVPGCARAVGERGELGER